MLAVCSYPCAFVYIYVCVCVVIYTLVCVRFVAMAGVNRTDTDSSVHQIKLKGVSTMRVGIEKFTIYAGGDKKANAFKV